MHRFVLFPILLVALALSAGCGGEDSVKPDTPQSAYAAYAGSLKGQADAEAAKITAIAGTASSCGDDRCVEHVAAIAALAGVKSGSGSTAPPPRQISGAEKVAAVVGAFSPLLGQAITGAVQWHQSDNAVKQSDSQYRYLDHVLSSALDGMATTAGNAVPSITVGGNLGDTYGDNFTGGDRTDVSGHLISGNGTTIGDRNGNSGRQDSPGPFQDACSGDGCQPAGNGGE